MHGIVFLVDDASPHYSLTLGRIIEAFLNLCVVICHICLAGHENILLTIALLIS